MGLFVLGDFVMHSGGIGKYKVDCDHLTDGDLACLAYMLAERLPPFTSVSGIPRGGLRLAQAMKKYVSDRLADTHLLVDDVLTTGKSMEEERAKFQGDVIGAVVFARASEVPPWITPLFRLTPAS